MESFGKKDWTIVNRKKEDYFDICRNPGEDVVLSKESYITDLDISLFSLICFLSPKSLDTYRYIRSKITYPTLIINIKNIYRGVSTTIEDDEILTPEMRDKLVLNYSRKYLSKNFEQSEENYLVFASHLFCTHLENVPEQYKSTILEIINSIRKNPPRYIESIFPGVTEKAALLCETIVSSGKLLIDIEPMHNIIDLPKKYYEISQRENIIIILPNNTARRFLVDEETLNKISEICEEIFY